MPEDSPSSVAFGADEVESGEGSALSRMRGGERD